MKPKTLVELTKHNWVLTKSKHHEFKKDYSLKNKTILISGASRGIGFEIAKKIAKDNSNIIILAKTVEPHPKL
jgi:citronellol/citronellal dehydrogenase